MSGETPHLYTQKERFTVCNVQGNRESELTEQGDRDRQTRELKCHCFNQIINKRQMLKAHLSSICLHTDDSQVIYSHDRLITEENSGHR